jgi:hypothetical protein
MADSEKILDRVRKLLALATSSNVHEAANAAARAQELITRHKLQALLDARSEDEATLSDGRDAPLEKCRKVRKWKAALASGLARANGCEAYTVSAGRKEEHLCVAGRPDDQAAVAALWAWLVKRLEWLSATHSGDGSRDWHESFRIGAADTIVERLVAVEQVERVALTTASSDAAALVRLDAALEMRAKAVATYAQAKLGLKSGRGITVRVDALEAGRAAGRKIPLPDR